MFHFNYCITIEISTVFYNPRLSLMTKMYEQSTERRINHRSCSFVSFLMLRD